MPVFSDFEFSLLPTVLPAGDARLELHNATFDFWRSFWTPVLKNLDGTNLCPSDFFRQRWVGVLSYSDSAATVSGDNKGQAPRIVGLFTATVFNLESIANLEHPYLKASYEADFVPFLRTQGARSCLSIEYLSVHPDFRNRGGHPLTTRFSFIRVLLGLAFKLAKREHVDVAIGTTRVDHKVDQRAREFGMRSMPVRLFHNVPVASSYVLRQDLRDCSQPAERHLIKQIWSHTDIQHSVLPKREEDAA